MTCTFQSASRTLLAAVLLAAVVPACAQLLGQPQIPERDPARVRRTKQRHVDAEWMWQYGPPPTDGRQHELIQDPHFQPFLAENLTAPQSFWGPQKEGLRKTLAETAYDFLTIPGRVLSDQNRYMTVTGHVFRFPASRGLLFADLNGAQPLVVFAAIDWVRDGRPTGDADAEYTLWIFPNRTLLGRPDVRQAETPVAAAILPAALQHSLGRWMEEPVAGTTMPQKVSAAVLVDPDGTPHQIAIPKE